MLNKIINRFRRPVTVDTIMSSFTKTSTELTRLSAARFEEAAAHRNAAAALMVKGHDAEKEAIRATGVAMRIDSMLG